MKLYGFVLGDIVHLTIAISAKNAAKKFSEKESIGGNVSEDHVFVLRSLKFSFSV